MILNIVRVNNHQHHYYLRHILHSDHSKEREQARISRRIIFIRNVSCSAYYISKYYRSIYKNFTTSATLQRHIMIYPFARRRCVHRESAICHPPSLNVYTPHIAPCTMRIAHCTPHTAHHSTAHSNHQPSPHPSSATASNYSQSPSYPYAQPHAKAYTYETHALNAQSRSHSHPHSPSA